MLSTRTHEKTMDVDRINFTTDYRSPDAKTEAQKNEQPIGEDQKSRQNGRSKHNRFN